MGWRARSFPPGGREGAVASGSGQSAAVTHAEPDRGTLARWAQAPGHARAPGRSGGGLRFAFYGRVSTEDWQDPVTSLARQRAQAEALVRGHGRVVAEFLDTGQSRTVAWARRPQAAVLVAALADPGRGWDAVVVGEYERAFYGSQYGLMAPLFEHYGVQLWMPETGGRVDYACEHDERAMTMLGLSSKREIARTSIRVRTAMAAQTRQGRYLGGRSPYGYRLADAGPQSPRTSQPAASEKRAVDPLAGADLYSHAGLVQCAGPVVDDEEAGAVRDDAEQVTGAVLDQRPGSELSSSAYAPPWTCITWGPAAPGPQSCGRPRPSSCTYWPNAPRCYPGTALLAGPVLPARDPAAARGPGPSARARPAGGRWLCRP